MKRPIPPLLFITALLPFLEASCANTSHVIVYQHSNMGLNVAANPATQSVHVRIGIRNQVAVITPKLVNPAWDPSKPAPVDDQGKPLPSQPQYRAASSYVASRFRVQHVYAAPEVAEIIATGNAATSVGESVGADAFLGGE